jgi:hypothetical protein
MLREGHKRMEERAMCKRITYRPFLVVLSLFMPFLLTACGSAPSCAPSTDADRFARTISPHLQLSIDSRVELMSVIYYLSGTHPEYNGNNAIKRYRKAVDAHFAKYKDLPAVRYTTGLSRTWGYDKPAALAVHLTDSTTLNERAPFSRWSLPEGLTHSWSIIGIGKARELVRLSRPFVKETEWESFVQSQAPLYNEKLDELAPVFRKCDVENWMLDFLGEELGQNVFHVVLCPLSGGNSYATAVRNGDVTEVYAFLGVFPDREGFRIPNDEFLKIVAHEWLHHYVNPIVGRNLSSLRESGKRLHKMSAEKMRQNAYPTVQALLQESVVRAIVLRLVEERWGSSAAANQAKWQKEQGFLWVPDLANLMTEYEQARDRYPTLESFFPRIIEFFDNWEPQST